MTRTEELSSLGDSLTHRPTSASEYRAARFFAVFLAQIPNYHKTSVIMPGGPGTRGEPHVGWIHSLDSTLLSLAGRS
jgi:hypothetical protein